MFTQACRQPPWQSPSSRRNADPPRVGKASSQTNHSGDQTCWNTSREDPSAVRSTAKLLHEQLTRKCKLTAWQPFREDELRPIMAKWKNNKSTGTDRISLKAVRYISLVRGGLGASSGSLTTSSMSASCPRGLPLLRKMATCNSAKRGSQSVELILALDVRKAFDSISQPYLSTLVTEKVGGTLPWEARAWLQLIGARGLPSGVRRGDAACGPNQRGATGFPGLSLPLLRGHRGGH